MKKYITLFILLIICILIALGLNSYLTNKDDFNFSLTYNVDGKDYVSTFDNTLRKDTVAGLKTIDFEFSKNDLNKIKDKIVELEIMEGDFKKLPHSGLIISPNGIYKLKIEMNGETKLLYWETGNSNPRPSEVLNAEDRYDGVYGRVYKLFDLKDFIIEIIEEYEEYQKLPPHNLYM